MASSLLRKETDGRRASRKKPVYDPQHRKDDNSHVAHRKLDGVRNDGASLNEVRQPPWIRFSGRRRRTRNPTCNTVNLRAVQLLLGHKKMESAARYLGIEVDDGLTSPWGFLS